MHANPAFLGARSSDGVGEGAYPLPIQKVRGKFRSRKIQLKTRETPGGQIRKSRVTKAMEKNIWKNIYIYIFSVKLEKPLQKVMIASTPAVPSSIPWNECLGGRHSGLTAPFHGSLPGFHLCS